MKKFDIKIPEDLVVFISGVPGVGKTTISYELLKAFPQFRIIEETDLIREVLRGYNDYIKNEFGEVAQPLFDKIEIYDHMKFLSFDEAKKQCQIMKNSFEKIVARQQRKGIPSIVNGVHIIPEILDGLAKNRNIIYINLFITNEHDIYNRLKERNPDKYSKNYISLIYKTNIDLYLSTLKLADKAGCIFNSIDVTALNVLETLNEVVECIIRRIEDAH
jgi:2-phosphoglycerate kinase